MTLLSELQNIYDNRQTTTTKWWSYGAAQLTHSLKILNYLLWTKYPFRLVWKGNSSFFATINLSCLLSTWISFDLREKDASKTGERGLGGFHKRRHLFQHYSIGKSNFLKSICHINPLSTNLQGSRHCTACIWKSLIIQTINDCELPCEQVHTDLTKFKFQPRFYSNVTKRNQILTFNSILNKISAPRSNFTIISK